MRFFTWPITATTMTVLSLLLAFSLTLAAAPGGSAPQWELVADFDFRGGNELGPDWALAVGTATPSATGLGLSERAELVYLPRLTGLQRIEIIARAEDPADLSPILHSADGRYGSGYYLQFGGMSNQLNRMTRLGMPVSLGSDLLIEPGKWHTIIAEFDGETVRLIVDGETLHSFFEEEQPLWGDHFPHLGFHTYAESELERIRIFTAEPAGHLQPAAADQRHITQPAPSGNLLGDRVGDHNRWTGLVRGMNDPNEDDRAYLMLPHETTSWAPPYVPICPARTYTLSGEFRSAQPDHPSRMLLDLRFFTQDHQPLGPWNTRTASPVATVTQDTPAGALQINATDQGWKVEDPTWLRMVLFAADDDSDLPNFNVVRFKNISREDDNITTIELSEPLPVDVPAGSGIRLHRYQDHPRVFSNSVPFEWTKFSFTVTPEPPEDGPLQDHVWPGAAYVRVMVMNHYNQWPTVRPSDVPPPVLHFRNIDLREVPEVDGDPR